MDAIRTYIDQMFRSLPQTSEVRRAQAELLQMSEDRYNELRSEGASDNEAVGRVITQFGNLDELADDLGIRTEVDGRKETTDVVQLSAAEADNYLANRRSAGRLIAAGVFAIVIGLGVMVLISNGLSDGPGDAVGLAVFFVGLAGGVGMFIVGGMSMARFNRLEGHDLLLDPATAARFRDVREQESGRYVASIAAGVVVLILGVAVVAVAGAIWGGDALANAWSVVVLFLAVGTAVAILTTAGIRRSALDRLTRSDDHRPVRQRKSTLTGMIAGPYWMFVLVVFLAWSFIGSAWDRSWIVWPIAAVLFGFVAASLGAIESNRGRR